MPHIAFNDLFYVNCHFHLSKFWGRILVNTAFLLVDHFLLIAPVYSSKSASEVSVIRSLPLVQNNKL